METKELFSLLGTTIRYLDKDYEAGDTKRVIAGANTLALLSKELLNTVSPASTLVEADAEGWRTSERVMAAVAASGKLKRRTPPNPSGGANGDFRAAILKAIAAEKQPIAAAKLLARLNKAGVAIPGSGSYNNFSGYLLRMQKSGLITKFGRGMYGLPEWQENQEPVFDEELVGAE